MKYVSIDIETTGLDPKQDQILEFGAIVEDTNEQLPFESIPKFRAIFLYERLSGSPFALYMNKEIIKEIADAKKPYLEYYESTNQTDCCIGKKGLYTSEEGYLQNRNPGSEFSGHFHEFLKKQYYSKGKLAYLEKNKKEGTDMLRFEINVAGKNFSAFDKLFLNELGVSSIVTFNRRVLDPSIFYVNVETDGGLPNLGLCKKRAGLGHGVSHTAIDDAWDVILLLRNKYEYLIEK